MRSWKSMPIPDEHREFLHQLNRVERNAAGDLVLRGLSSEETDEWFRLALDRDLRVSIQFHELDEKHMTATRKVSPPPPAWVQARLSRQDREATSLVGT